MQTLPPNDPKPEACWLILGPQGGTIHTNPTRSGAISEAVRAFEAPGGEYAYHDTREGQWRVMRRKGWRCVRGYTISAERLALLLQLVAGAADPLALLAHHTQLTVRGEVSRHAERLLAAAEQLNR